MGEKRQAVEMHGALSCGQVPDTGRSSGVQGFKVNSDPTVPRPCDLGSFAYILSLGWQSLTDRTQDRRLSEVRVMNPRSVHLEC